MGLLEVAVASLCAFVALLVWASVLMMRRIRGLEAAVGKHVAEQVWHDRRVHDWMTSHRERLETAEERIRRLGLLQAVEANPPLR